MPGHVSHWGASRSIGGSARGVCASIRSRIVRKMVVASAATSAPGPALSFELSTSISKPGKRGCVPL